MESRSYATIESVARFAAPFLSCIFSILAFVSLRKLGFSVRIHPLDESRGFLLSRGERRTSHCILIEKDKTLCDNIIREFKFLDVNVSENKENNEIQSCQT